MHSLSKDFAFEPITHVIIAIVSIVISYFLNFAFAKILVQLTWMQQFHVAISISIFAVFGILEWLFQKYIWRVFAFCKVPGVIDLNGKWDGQLNIGDTSPPYVASQPYLASLKIEQSWSKILIEFDAQDAEGVSFGAAILRGRQQGKKQELLYSYHAKSKKSGKTGTHFDHFGTSLLTISADRKELKGYYFTEPTRSSHGEAIFSLKVT